MAEKQQLVLSVLEATKPQALASLPQVEANFVAMFNTIHGTNRGSMVYESEKFHFQKQIAEKPELAEATKLSLYGAFMDVAVQGLSFDPSKKLAYLMTRNVKTIKAGKETWEKRAYLTISPYGELFLRIVCGQIRAADNPEVVYQDEPFEVISTGNGKTVEHKLKFPREGKIIASYIRIVKPDGSVDFGVCSLDDIERFAQASAKQNRGTANALYTSNGGQIDKGFLLAKTIKHAFRSYPKVQVRGKFSATEEDLEREEDLDYGLDIVSEEPIESAPIETPTVATKKEAPSPEAKKTKVEINETNSATAQMTMTPTEDGSLGF